MKKLKTFELFEKEKHRGNFLTKQDQPKKKFQ